MEANEGVHKIWGFDGGVDSYFDFLDYDHFEDWNTCTGSRMIIWNAGSVLPGYKVS